MIAICLGVWLTLWAAGTPTGRVMRRILVEAPARMLGAIPRGQYLLLATVLLACGTLAWLTEGEAVRMMLMGAPELLGILASVEIGALVDLLAATLVTASTLRWRALVGRARQLVSRPSHRARRTHSAASRQEAANDDDDDDAATMRTARGLRF